MPLGVTSLSGRVARGGHGVRTPGLSGLDVDLLLDHVVAGQRDACHLHGLDGLVLSFVDQECYVDARGRAVDPCSELDPHIGVPFLIVRSA